MKTFNKLRITALAITSLSFLLLTACGSRVTSMQEGRVAAEDFIAKGNASAITMALVDSDKILWSQSFGLADREAAQAPTENTMFGIGSISKMFAAISVMKLVDRGLVKLDEPVVTYVPNFKMADERYKEISIRMLINHSAGLPGSEYRNAIIRTPVPQYLNQLMESLKTQHLKAPPGFMSVYCNDCVTLVEAVVAATTGKSYATFVQDEILTPLGMEHTRFANTYFPQGSYAKAYVNGTPKPQEIVNLLATGGLSSTANDIARIAIMFLNRGVYNETRILSEASVAEMAIDQTANKFNPIHSATWAYGLGWDSVTQPGLLAVGYDGWAKGGDTTDYGSQLVVSPKAGLGVVVIGATGFGSDKAKIIAERVLLRELAERGAISAFPSPLESTPLPVITPDQSFLSSIAGEYAIHNSIFKLEAQLDGSAQLFMRSDNAWSTVGQPLKLRNNGWLASDADPLRQVKVVTVDLLGETTQYLVSRSPNGYGHYLDSGVVSQKVQGKTNDLSPAWASRLSNTWLVVNEPADDLTWNNMDPRLGLITLPELKGLIFAHVPSETTGFIILDPSASDTVASSMLVIPQLNGRDLTDFTIVNRGAEEWVRATTYLHRPLPSVIPLQKSASNVVTIGPEGYSEWRSVPNNESGAQLNITTNDEWRLYDTTFKTVAKGKGSGTAALPVGSAPGYLVVFGQANATITIQMD